MRAVIEEVVDGVVVEFHVRHKHSVVSVLINFGACLANLWNTQDVSVLWPLSTGVENMQMRRRHVGGHLHIYVSKPNIDASKIMNWETF